MQKCRDRASVSRMHGLIISSGLVGHGISIAQLISSYGRVGDFELAHKLLVKSPNAGIDAWNAMIIAYSRKDCPCEAIKLYRKMSHEGAKPDSSTFTMTIKARTDLWDLNMGEAIWNRAVQCGYGKDVFVGSSVLKLYSTCGTLDQAMDVVG